MRGIPWQSKFVGKAKLLDFAHNACLLVFGSLIRYSVVLAGFFHGGAELLLHGQFCRRFRLCQFKDFPHLGFPQQVADRETVFMFIHLDKRGCFSVERNQQYLADA